MIPYTINAIATVVGLKNNASIVSSNNSPSIPDGITAIITLVHKSIVSFF